MSSIWDDRLEVELIPFDEDNAIKANEDCDLRSHHHPHDGRIIARLPSIPELETWIKFDSHPPMKVLDVVNMASASSPQTAARVRVRLAFEGEFIGKKGRWEG